MQREPHEARGYCAGRGLVDRHGCETSRGRLRSLLHRLVARALSTLRGDPADVVVGALHGAGHAVQAESMHDFEHACTGIRGL